MQVVGIEVFSLPRGGIFLKSHRRLTCHIFMYILLFIFNFHACHKSEFWHFRYTWPTSSTGAHQDLMEKLEALVFNRSSIPGARPSPTFPNHITHWPSLPPLDACPPSASMVGNLNVGYRGRLFTSPGITQVLYFSSLMHLHHGTLDEVLIFCRNRSLGLREEKFGVDTLRRFMIVEAGGHYGRDGHLECLCLK